ncbi:hypothetical protein GCM10020219_033180 [Nonomuraea dietziae]
MAGLAVGPCWGCFFLGRCYGSVTLDPPPGSMDPVSGHVGFGAVWLVLGLGWGGLQRGVNGTVLEVGVHGMGGATVDEAGAGAARRPALWRARLRLHADPCPD